MSRLNVCDEHEWEGEARCPQCAAEDKELEKLMQQTRAPRRLADLFKTAQEAGHIQPQLEYA